MNDLERAFLTAATEGGAPPLDVDVPADATIRLAEGDGHLLAGSTITAWSRPEGRDA